MTTAVATSPRTVGEQVRPLCFAIGPYGKAGSQTRQWSDFVFTEVIAKVLGDDYLVQRTIDRPEAGPIMERIERDVRTADVVIADLTDANPNVYFELGFRHAIERPFIHLARADTVLPFDVANFEVILIQADYVKASVASESYYTAPNRILEPVREALRQQVKGIGPPARQKLPPFSAKVYRWEMWYSPSIATDWLAAQDEAFRDQVQAYERGGGADPIAEDSLALFAEYLALKSAASQSGVGTIFATINNQLDQLDLGYAAFKFSTAPEPILIDVRDVYCSGDGVASISFEQSSRPFPVERGGRTVSVMVPGYKYTLELVAANRKRGFVGTINHPRTSTKIGNAELTPRYGDLLG